MKSQFHKSMNTKDSLHKVFIFFLSTTQIISELILLDFSFDIGLNSKSIFDLLISTFGIFFMHQMNPIAAKFYILQIELRDKELAHFKSDKDKNVDKDKKEQ